MGKSGTGSGKKIRVLIVDDHAMVRQGLRTFLELQDASDLPIEVTGRLPMGGRQWSWQANPTRHRPAGPGHAGNGRVAGNA